MLFGLVALAVLGVQRAVYIFVPGQLGAGFVTAAFPPIIAVLANIQTAADLRAAPLPLSELFDLALTRLWAVIILDLVFYWSLGLGVEIMLSSSSIGNWLAGLIAFMLAATLIFADVYASVEPQPNRLRTLPLAIVRSVSLACQNGNLARVFSLASLLMLIVVAGELLNQWVGAHHVRDAVFLGEVPFGTLVQAPLSALVTAVYLDSLARERLRSA